MKFEYGVIEEVAPGVRRIVANNPSAFTFLVPARMSLVPEKLP